MSLELIRSKNKWFTQVVLFVIAIVFIFGFGYSFVNFGSMGFGSQGSAAEVNGEEIGLYEYYRLKDRMMSRFGQDAEIPEAAVQFIQAQALNQLIDMKLVSQKAREMGLKITDEELKEAIMTNPAFQIDGDFVGFAAYKNYVQQGLRENVGEFERKFKEELLAQKFINFINETAKISDEELQNLYRIQNERIKLAYLRFSPQTYLEKVQASEDEIAKQYKGNKGSYINSEKRSIEYITIKPEDFEKSIEISDDQLRKQYDTYKDDYVDSEGNTKNFETVKDEIRSQLISERKVESRQQFTAKLDEYSKTKQLNEIGKEFSIESVSSADVSLGDTTDQIPLTVVNKAFELSKGDKYFTNVSDNIWIVNIKEVLTQSEKSLEEARDDVIADVKLRKARELAKKEAQNTHRDLISKKVKFSELKTQKSDLYNETDYITRLDKPTGIGSNDVLLDTFLLSQQNPTYKEVYESGDSYLILSFVERKEVDPEEFEEKKEGIRNSVMQRKQNEIYRDWILSIRKQAEIKPNPRLFPEVG